MYRGTVGSLGKDANLVEKVAPPWLGELLLKVKSFIWWRIMLTS
jgi:hypothetical protein